MRIKSTILLIGLVVFSLSMSTFQSNSSIQRSNIQNSSVRISKNNGSYVQSNNISIHSNTDFVTQAKTNNWPGSGTKNDPYIISGFVFDRIAFNTRGIVSTDVALIQISNVNLYFIIEHNLFNASIQYAIYFDSVSNGIIKNNFFGSGFPQNDLAIYIGQSNNLLVTNNEMFFNSTLNGGFNTVKLENDENCSFLGNTLRNFPFIIRASSKILIQNNLFNDSYLNIETSVVNVSYNRLVNNQFNGIAILPEFYLVASIKLRTGSIIENNLFLNDSTGIFLSSASPTKMFITCPGFAECSELPSHYSGLTILHYSNNIIRTNEFMNNSRNAIFISARDDNNTIYGNNFINNNQSINTLNSVIQNTSQVYESQIQNKTNYWSFNGVGNYWSDYNYLVNTSATSSTVPMRFLANDSDPHPEISPFDIKINDTSQTISPPSIFANDFISSLLQTIPYIIVIGVIGIGVFLTVEYVDYRKKQRTKQLTSSKFLSFVRGKLSFRRSKNPQQEVLTDETLEKMEEIIEENKET